MPTRLHLYPNARARFFARQGRQRLGQRVRRQQTFRAPFLGWCPDAPPHLVSQTGANNVQGLVAMLWPGQGEFLRPDDGFAQLDPARLPLGSGSGTATTLLAQFRQATSNAIEYIAVNAGDGAATPIEVNRLVAGVWTIVTKNAAAANQVGDRDVMRDSAEFEFGAPTRTPAITDPIMLFTGGNLSGPIDEVMITPDSTGLGAYDTLVRTGTGSMILLRAMSVESFEGRVAWLNTVEPAPTNNRPQRLRWSAVGTADPDPAIVGAGFLDFPEFNRQGLRVERLGNKLACYFGDGMAFAVPTGIRTDAFRPQIVSTRRGLLGTNSLTAISPWEHFGIFDDGWYLVDASGRFQEVGLLNLPNGGSVHRWRETFYSELDAGKRHRIAVSYDEFRGFIRIAYPTKSQSENLAVIVFDKRNNRAWRDTYSVSCWGTFDQETSPGVLIGALGPIGTLTVPIGSWAPTFGLEAVVHGTPTGFVMLRDTSITSRDGVEPAWFYETHTHSITENPLNRQTLNQVGIEYLNVGGPGVAVLGQSNFDQIPQSESSPFDEGVANSMQTAITHFRLDGSHHSLILSGTAPVAIRSFTPEYLVYEGHDVRDA